MSTAIDPAFLVCRFGRCLEWEEDPQGAVIVFRPRFGKSGLGKRTARLLGLDDYRIRLDEMGSLVWRQCDRETAAATIVGQLRATFGSRIEPAENRLHDFIVQMSRAKMIEILS